MQSCLFKNWRLISRRWWDHILRICRGGDFCFGKLGILCLRDCFLKLARFGYYPSVCCSIDNVNFPDSRIWSSWCVFFVFWCLRRYSGYWLRLRSRFRFPVSFWSWSRALILCLLCNNLSKDGFGDSPLSIICQHRPQLLCFRLQGHRMFGIGVNRCRIS